MYTVRTGIVHKARRCRGFTFIELLVVLAIIAVLVLLSMTGIRNYGQRQQYLEFARAVGDGLSEARAKTLAGIGETTHGVYIGTATIEFYSGATPTVGNPANTILTIPSYINATSSFPAGVNYVTFSRLTGEPNVTGTIDIGHRRAAATTTFTIYASGLVQ